MSENLTVVAQSLYLKLSEPAKNSRVHVERDYAGKARRMIFGQTSQRRVGGTALENDK